MTAPEALYLRALLGDAWTVTSGGGEPPHTLRATCGDQEMTMSLRYNGGDPHYVIDAAPPDVIALLAGEQIRPVRRWGGR